MPSTPFVPAGFDVPRGLETEQFALEPLGPEHNEADYDAWTSSVDHIGATHGFVGYGWPREMTLEENRDDLQRHADDFGERRGFTYTVLDRRGGDVVGCVYIYPDTEAGTDASVASWVRASRAELDEPLRATVRDWLAAAWPFDSVRY